MNIQPDIDQINEAQAFAENNQFCMALALYSEIINTNPTEWKSYNGRANCKLSLNDYHGVLKDYQKALELDPDKYNLGNFHHEIGDYKVIPF